MQIVIITLILMLDAMLAFFVSLLSRWSALRFAGWFLIPVIVAVFVCGGPQNFSLAIGEKEMVWYVFGFFAMLGFGAAGIGTLLGYLVRQARKSKA